MSKPSSAGSGLRALGVPTEGGGLYEVALTHRSFAFEQPAKVAHNERLELVGDAILGLVVADLIYRSHPEMAEGEIARLRSSVVDKPALAEVARGLGLGQHIRLGKGEEASGGRNKNSLLADTLEAVIGAVYLSRGFDYIAEHLKPIFTERLAAATGALEPYDAKTALQELAVAAHGQLPSYRVASSGPDHDKSFSAVVYIEHEIAGSGAGKSKKEAEQNAARVALLALQTAEPSAGSGGRRVRGKDVRARAS
ncbi:MAG TPA: ribonuclease III [Actinomycetota bacterium]|nr:ribonuclease III [Actinomycetota bacterium]